MRSNSKCWSIETLGNGFVIVIAHPERGMSRNWGEIAFFSSLGEKLFKMDETSLQNSWWLMGVLRNPRYVLRDCKALASVRVSPRVAGNQDPSENTDKSENR